MKYETWKSLLMVWVGIAIGSFAMLGRNPDIEGMVFVITVVIIMLVTAFFKPKEAENEINSL